MSIFDSDLIAPGLPNASLAGIPFRINPQTVNLSYNVKTNKVQTLGGMVVQVYGVTLSDLVVEGVFGSGGRAEQQIFFNQIQAIAAATVAAQRTQPNLSQVGNDVVFSTGSVPFVFPLLNYDLQVYVKGYTSLEGGPQAVVESNQNFNPSWQLTLLIENDNTGLLTTTAANTYINRVAAGLGAGENLGGQLNQFLGSSSSEINSFMHKFANGATSFSQVVAQAYGAAAGAAVNIAPASNASVTGVTGSLAPQRTGPITVNQWAVDVLATAGLPQSSTNITALAVWYQAEGGWSRNSNKFNPLNTNMGEGVVNNPYGAIMQSTGDAAYASYAQGIQATADTLNGSNMSAIRSAFANNSSLDAILTAIQDSPWASSHYGYALTTYPPAPLQSVIGTA